jgi:hypothetical protein
MSQLNKQKDEIELRAEREDRISKTIKNQMS